MRKVLSTLVIACAAVVAAASLAYAAPHKHCNTLYTPRCTKPTITVRSLPAACKKPSASFTLPTIRFNSIAGIRQIKITLGATVLFTKKFKGLGPQHYTVKGLKVHTKGLSTGGHTVKISVKDNGGRTATRDLRFTTCPPPVFTG